MAVDPTAVETLDALEATRGLSLPASVREWLSLEGAAAILRRPEDAQKLTLGEPIDDIDCVAEGWLVVQVENQGVVYWAVPLDAGDDPPVYGAEDPEWDAGDEPYAASFSDWVHSLARRWHAMESLPVREDDGSDAPVEPQIRALENELGLEGVAFPEWLGQREWTFGSADVLVHVRDFGGPSEWTLWAKDAAAMTRLRDTLAGAR